MLTEEQLEEARIELERRKVEKLTKIKRITPQIKNIEGLCRISHFEGTEAGEFWDQLYELHRQKDFLSDTFIKSLDREINRVIKQVKEDYWEVIDGDGETVDLEFKN